LKIFSFIKFHNIILAHISYKMIKKAKDFKKHFRIKDDYYRKVYILLSDMELILIGRSTAKEVKVETESDI
jgi:hypothetical protein